MCEQLSSCSVIVVFTVVRKRIIYGHSDIPLPQCRKVVSEKTAIWEKRFLLFNHIKVITLILCYSYNLWAGLCHTYVQLQPLSTEPYSLTTFLSLAYQNIHTYNIFLWCSNCSIMPCADPGGPRGPWPPPPYKILDPPMYARTLTTFSQKLLWSFNYHKMHLTHFHEIVTYNLSALR